MPSRHERARIQAAKEQERIAAQAKANEEAKAIRAQQDKKVRKEERELGEEFL